MNRWGLWLWQCADGIYRRIRHFDYEDMQGENIFRIRIRHYNGPEFRLPGGEEVRRGDWVGFLHLYNMRLQRLVQGIQSENRRSLMIVREAKRSLPELAAYLQRHPRGERIKTLIGVTLLNRGVEHLGFQVMTLPDTWWYRFRNWYMLHILAWCHPDGRRRLQRRREALVLKRLVLPREELFSLYGKVSGKVSPELVIDIDK
jgi:hypothetical protein